MFEKLFFFSIFTTISFFKITVNRSIKSHYWAVGQRGEWATVGQSVSEVSGRVEIEWRVEREWRVESQSP